MHLCQGDASMYPPPSSAGPGGFPPDGVYPPPGAGAGAHHGAAPYPPAQGPQGGQGLYPPPYSSGSHPRRPYGRSLSDDDGDLDYDVVDDEAEKRTRFRERSGPSAGEQDLPPRPQNSRIRPRDDSPW